MRLYQGKPIYNRLFVFCLSIFFGIMGADRIYLKDFKGGFFKLVTLGGFGIWAFLDLFRLGMGEKIGDGNYWWSCELDGKNCKDEDKLIFRFLALFAGLTIIIIYFYSPTDTNTLKFEETNQEHI